MTISLKGAAFLSTIERALDKPHKFLILARSRLPTVRRRQYPAANYNVLFELCPASGYFLLYYRSGLRYTSRANYSCSPCPSLPADKRDECSRP